MKTMLEFIISIPEEIGWAIVGFVACLCCVMLYKLGKMFVEMWKEWREPSIIFSDTPSVPEGEFRIGKEFAED